MSSIKPFASHRVVSIARDGTEHYISEGQSYATALGIRKDYLRRITETGSYYYMHNTSKHCTIYLGSRIVEHVEVQPMPRHRHTYEEAEMVYCVHPDTCPANPDTCPANPNYKPRHRKDV